MFREMRRYKQQISREECEALLKSAPRGVLAVQGDEDYPYAVPLDFLWQEGHLYFHCAKEGHKLDAIRRNEKVSFCVLSEGVQEENDWWFHFTSVIVFGRVREVETEEERLRLLRLFGAKYYPTEEGLEAEMQKGATRALVLDLQIEHMTGKRIREN